MAASARILIVDDDLAFLRMLSTALEPLYDVLMAGTGWAALDIIVRRAPDLVLLDYFLPDVPGLAVLRTAKKKFPSLPLIVMTGFGTEDLSVEAFRSGARDYIKKPISLADLLARIEAVLGVRRGRAKPRIPLVLETRPEESQPGRDTRAASLRRAIAFIEANFDSDLTLDRVSCEAGMSKSHFCRAFKGSTGVTFGRYLARRRVARAAELLRTSNRSVTEICLEVGFNDTAHFSRVFRKLTGQPPSLFRRTYAPLPQGAAPSPRNTAPIRP